VSKSRKNRQPFWQENIIGLPQQVGMMPEKWSRMMIKLDFQVKCLETMCGNPIFGQIWSTRLGSYGTTPDIHHLTQSCTGVVRGQMLDDLV
jgi:hypothetical protein